MHDPLERDKEIAYAIMLIVWAVPAWRCGIVQDIKILMNLFVFRRLSGTGALQMSSKQIIFLKLISVCG